VQKNVDRPLGSAREAGTPTYPPQLVHVPSPTRNSSASLTLVGDEPSISSVRGLLEGPTISQLQRILLIAQPENIGVFP
jgi:hypothetical protein